MWLLFVVCFLFAFVWLCSGSSVAVIWLFCDPCVALHVALMWLVILWLCVGLCLVLAFMLLFGGSSVALL